MSYNKVNRNSQGVINAKHISGPTLGHDPVNLYPIILQHIQEDPRQVQLRDDIVTKERSMMMGAPDEAAFLGWLLRLTGAKKVVEVGVFRGSTTLALARALPADGKVVGLDISDDFAQLGKQAWADMGVANKIDFRVGAAADSMARMAADQNERETYDLVFIDADKLNYDTYYEYALQLLKPNGVIAVDNTLWGGLIATPPEAHAPDTRAICAINEKIRTDPRVDAVMLPIADGCYLARKK